MQKSKRLYKNISRGMRYRFSPRGWWWRKNSIQKPICLTKFKLVIKSVYPGKEFNDTCISELFPIVTDTIYGLYEVRDPTLNEIFKNCPIP